MSITSNGIKLHNKRKGYCCALLFNALELFLSALLVVTLSAHIIFPEQARAAAGASSVLSYQGRLTDSSGNALGGGSGTNYCFRFSIYDDTNVGAPDNKLWPSGTPSTMTVNVANGVFNVGIGDTGAGGDSLATYSFASTTSVYLNVEVNDTPTTCSGGWDNLSPRQRLDSVAYARAAYELYGGNARIGRGSGETTGSQKYLHLDQVTNSETIGGACPTNSVNGSVWYNSNHSRALICELNIIKVLKTIGNGTTTVDAVAITGNTEGTPVTVTSGTVSLAGGNNITLSQAGNAMTVRGAYNPAQFTNSTANATMNLLWAGNSNGSGNITMGLIGSTITANAPSGGGVIFGMSNLGVSTAGTSGTVGSQFIVVGGVGIIGSQSINGQSATLSLVNSWSTATMANAIGTTNVVGANAGRFALEGHQHAGIPVAGISGGNTLNTSGTYYGSLMFAGGNNITLSAVTGAGGQTITISGGAGGGGFANYIAAGGVTTNGLNTINFSNANGVSFGLGAGANSSVMTASVNAGGGINGISAGTFSTNPTSLYFSNANGVTFGLNSGASSSVITASVNAGGGAAPTLNYWDNMPWGATNSGGAGGFAFTGSHRSLFVIPLNGFYHPFPGDITANTMLLNLSQSGSTATMSQVFTSNFYIGVYTLNTLVSSLSLLDSVNASFARNPAATNNSTGFVGQRFLPILSSQWSSQPVFKNGSQYWLGYFWSSAGVLNQSNSILGFYRFSTAQRSGSINPAASNTATSMGWGPFYGIYTATTNALPTAINTNQLNKVNAAAGFNPHIIFNNSAQTAF